MYIGLAVCVVALSIGCSDTKDREGAPAEADACERRTGERTAERILRCTEGSVALVSTELARGTGVVVELAGARYVLTNAHVVDPFDAADLAFGEDWTYDVKVIGIDAAADIAVLGPLTGDNLPQPLTWVSGTGVERGDDLFLVGYPGVTDVEDVEVTIAGGIVSRLRTFPEFGQTYIQTDATSAGGQSGGPLFDREGRIVGVSGLLFEDSFVLALSGRDVMDAAKRVVSGSGDSYVALPATDERNAGSASGSVHLANATDWQGLFLPQSSESRTWHLKVPSATGAMAVVTRAYDGEPIASSRSIAEFMELWRRAGADDDELWFDPSDLTQVADRETGPGEFTIPVAVGESALVWVMAPVTDAPLDVAWSSDLLLTAASKPVEEISMAIGDDPIDRVLGAYDTAIDVLVELTEGQRVTIAARSPQGDPAFYVFGPDEILDAETIHRAYDEWEEGEGYYDDSGHGPFGLDAEAVYTARTTGVHRFHVLAFDGEPTLLRFSVVDCGCDARDDDEEDEEDA
jgi:S1-C subfamily serine protease